MRHKRHWRDAPPFVRERSAPWRSWRSPSKAELRVAEWAEANPEGLPTRTFRGPLEMFDSPGMSSSTPQLCLSNQTDWDLLAAHGGSECRGYPECHSVWREPH